MKQNQAVTYSNLTPYLFQWFPKSKFLSFMTKVNRSNGSEPKSDIFPWDIQIWHYIFFYQIIIKCFNDFRNRNFSVLWLTWNQTMEVKPKSVIFPGDIFKSDIIFHWSQNIKLFQWLLYLAHDFYKFNTNI